jgi:zinc protease
MGTDVVAIEVLLDISAADEPADKLGIRYLTQRLLLRGTTNETGDSMAQRLSKVGGLCDVSVGLDYAELYVLVPADGFELAVSLVADMLRHPAFLPDQVEKQREQSVAAARASEDDAFQATYQALRDGLYKDHPYHRPAFGDSRSLAGITRDDIAAFYGAFYRPSRTVIAVCGGVSDTRALRAVRSGFGDWRADPAPPRPKEEAAPVTSSEVIARELPSRRAQVMIGFLAPAAGQQGYYELQVMDSLLTGRSSARLPKLIREQLGLAYEVSSFCPTLAGPSHFVVYVITEPFSVEAVRSAVLDALAKLRAEPPSAEELEKAKRFLIGSYALGHQRMRDQAYALAWYEILGLGSDFGDRYLSAIQTITPAQVQATANAILQQPVIAVAMPAD